MALLQIDLQRHRSARGPLVDPVASAVADPLADPASVFAGASGRLAVVGTVILLLPLVTLANTTATVLLGIGIAVVTLLTRLSSTDPQLP